MKKIFHITGREDWRKLRNDKIPGGAHTYSKGDDQFSANSPAALVRGEGAWTWSDDGRKFLDMAMGLRSVGLGHCYKPVVSAVAKALTMGSNLSRPSIYEAKFAENFLKALGWADMVKLCKNGSTATSAAIKLARAYTDRPLVARCAQQPFFSYDDWFIGSTVCPRGVPRQISELTVQFNYDDLASVDALIAKHPKQIACLILEPATDRDPSPGFLKGLRERCDKHGIVLIFDEMVIGFRLALGGGTQYYGVTPDLATFGKAMGNGFAMAAVAGKRAIMELGDIKDGRTKVFLVSTTHGAEIGGIVASQAALNVYQTKPVIETITSFGAKLKKEFNALSESRGLGNDIRLLGLDCMPALTITTNGQPDPVLRTLFQQEMIKRGVLIPYTAPCFSHGKRELAFLLKAFDSVAPVLRRALDENRVRETLVGPAVKPVFRTVN